MKRILLFFVLLLFTEAMIAAPNNEVRTVAVRYYQLLQQYADKVESTELREEAMKLFSDDDGGKIYNDLRQYKESSSENKLEMGGNYFSTIAYLKNMKHINLTFSVDPNKFEYSSTDISSQGDFSKIYYITIEKEIEGLPVGKIVCHEIMAVEKGKICYIQNYEKDMTIGRALELCQELSGIISLSLREDFVTPITQY